MPNIFIERTPERRGLLLPLGGTAEKPSLMFVFNHKLDRSELDHIIRANLATQGITDEAEIQTIINKAEIQYEQKLKNLETMREAKRLLEIRAKGGKLMSTGYRKWAQAFYPSGGK